MADDTKVARIEHGIDREIANQLPVSRSSAGTFTIAPQNMGELLEFSKLMSVSGFCVRPAFRGNPGACLGVALQAFRCGGDPFAWANKAYITKNKSGEEQISYEAQLVHAIVNSSSVLQRRLRPIFEGEGPTRRCRIEGWVRGEGEMLPYQSPPVSQIGVKNSPLWVSDPDQQLFYYSTRAWARRHVPEILLGIYAPEDFADTIDLTPEPEPRREDFITDNRKPEPVDDRPEFEVCDNEGVVHVYRDGARTAEAITAVLQEAGRHGSARFEAAWDNNQATVDHLAEEGFDEAAELARLFNTLRSFLKASQAETTAGPGRDGQAAGHPGADEESGGTAEQRDRLGDPSRRGDEQQSGPSSLEGDRRATAEGEGKADVAGNNPLPPSGAQGSPLTHVAPDPANGPSNPESPHSAPAAATAPAVEQHDDRKPELFIPPPVRNGKPDYRTWAVALFMPKVRQIKEGDRLAFLIGDNHENLAQARLVLKGDDLRDLDGGIKIAQDAAVWPS